MFFFRTKNYVYSKTLNVVKKPQQRFHKSTGGAMVLYVSGFLRYNSYICYKHTKCTCTFSVLDYLLWWYCDDISQSSDRCNICVTFTASCMVCYCFVFGRNKQITSTLHEKQKDDKKTVRWSFDKYIHTDRYILIMCVCVRFFRYIFYCIVSFIFSHGVAYSRVIEVFLQSLFTRVIRLLASIARPM